MTDYNPEHSETCGPPSLFCLLTSHAYSLLRFPCF